MTNGISVNDIVQVKSTGEIGRVVAIDDHTDRLPADLCLYVIPNYLLAKARQLGTSFDPYSLNLERLKFRVDEVTRVVDMFPEWMKPS